MRTIYYRCSFWLLLLGLTIIPTSHTHAQAEAILEAIKAAIKAVDLQVQKLQNHVIELQNIQKEAENELSKLKLQEISDWLQQQKDLYAHYFDELWQVKQVVVYWQRLSSIVRQQGALIKAYQQAIGQLRQDSHFSAAELTQMDAVYTGIVQKSVVSVQQLLTFLTSYAVQMSDGERLSFLNKYAQELEQQITDLHAFTNQNIMLSLQRSKAQNELQTIQRLYGLPK